VAGVRTVEDVDRLLRAGADKAGINTAAVVRPQVIDEITERFGSQVLTLSLDARRSDRTDLASGYEVTVKGGREGTGIDAVAWAQEAAKRGVGEILLNSIDADGTKDGFDLQMIRDVRAAVHVPLIASGGAGVPEHFPPAIAAGADAVLAASVFHFGPDDMITRVKAALRASGAEVR
jgi:cyclase